MDCPQPINSRWSPGLDRVDTGVMTGVSSKMTFMSAPQDQLGLDQLRQLLKLDDHLFQILAKLCWIVIAVWRLFTNSVGVVLAIRSHGIERRPVEAPTVDKQFHQCPFPL